MLWVIALGVIVFLYACLIERNWYAIRKTELEILKPGAQPIIVLHISDLHLAPWQKRKVRWIQNLAERVKPDLVVNTGDNLGHPKAINTVLEALSPLGKIPGVFVNGSNDMFAPAVRNPFSYLFKPSNPHKNSQKRVDVQALTTGFRKFGWEDLNNNSEAMQINNSRLVFFGTDDAHEDRANFDFPHVPREGGEVIIGVTHAPYQRVLNVFGHLGAEIVFAGHTHGGQVCVPFTGKALVTNCDLPRKYARGLHRTHNFWLQVCAGLGTSIYAPFRLACRPEVRVLVLKPISSQNHTHLNQVPDIAPTRYHNEQPAQQHSKL